MLPMLQCSSKNSLQKWIDGAISDGFRAFLFNTTALMFISTHHTDELKPRNVFQSPTYHLREENKTTKGIFNFLFLPKMVIETRAAVIINGLMCAN